MTNMDSVQTKLGQSSSTNNSGISDTYKSQLHKEIFGKYKEVLLEKNNQAYAVIQALIFSVKESRQTTFHQFNDEVRECSTSLINDIIKQSTEDRTLLALRALTNIFEKITHKVDYIKDMTNIKQSIQLKGQEFANHCLQTHELIRRFSQPHIREGMTVLVHSQSSVVQSVLKHASERGLKLSVITTQGQPSNTGDSVKAFCQEAGMDCTVIYDSAVPIYMPNVDVVFVGCEAVLANGGIVNKIGTYSVALIAQHFQKQVYVFCESHKFTSDFPLSQDDVYEMLENISDKESVSKVDYTPPENISLFFTDMGIFTPSGISDELTQFFNN